jgi:hypothetical protein
VDSTLSGSKRAREAAQRPSAFHREESEVFSSYVGSRVGVSHGDRILEWCTNPQYSAQHVRHNNVRSLSAKAIKEFVPDGVQSADFTEPLDGSQRLIFYFRCLYDAIKELLRNARFTGRQYTQAVIKRDANGRRVYSAFNTGEVYEIAQVKAGPNVSPVPVFLSSDATLVSKSMGGHPIISESPNTSTV